MALVTSLLLAAALTAGQSPATGRLTGRVIEDGTTAPVSAARVMLMPNQPPRGTIGLPKQAATDENGRYVFEDVAPGVYRIDVQKAGLAPLTDRARMAPVTVGAGQTVTVGDIALRRGAVIIGRVFDPSGQPLSDARVTALRKRASPGPTSMPVGPGAQTNDLGEFRLFSLPPGEYYIVAAPRPDLPFTNAAQSAMTVTSTYFPGTPDLSAAQSVRVGAGQTVGEIAIRLVSVPAFQISGVVVDAGGTPVPNAMIMVMPDRRSGGVFLAVPPGRAQSDANGRFVVPNVTNGSYMVMASVPMMRVTTTAGTPTATSGATWASGASTSGTAGGVVTGSGSSAAFFQFSGGPSGGSTGSTPVSVTVDGANVTDVTVVTQQPTGR